MFIPKEHINPEGQVGYTVKRLLLDSEQKGVVGASVTRIVWLENI